MSWWQILLFPFAIIYDLITRCRNWLYDIGVFKSESFSKVFILSVGNLSVGGTGKTPMVEYLIRYGLENGWKMATLSRGYGRKTKGVIVGTEISRPEDIGDESCGYLKQFGDKIQVVVAESRVAGMNKIQTQFPEINVVILDDAFQHRGIKSDYSILLTTYAKPFWKDFILPSGMLREARKGYERADSIILTKCPKKEFDIPVLAQEKQFSATTIKYGKPTMVNGVLAKDVVAVSGIANNQSFFSYLSSQFEVTREIGFSDHHFFTREDVENIVSSVDQNGTLLCTYKDYVKLSSFDMLTNVSWGYVPIEVEFLSSENELQETLNTQYSLHTKTEMES